MPVSLRVGNSPLETSSTGGRRTIPGKSHDRSSFTGPGPSFGDGWGRSACGSEAVASGLRLCFGSQGFR